MDTIWKDLSDWEKEIRKKDESLNKRKAIHDKSLPPIQQPVKIIVDEQKPVGIQYLNRSRIPDKVEIPSKLTLKERAEDEKTKGNAFFGKQAYKEAILHYTKAIGIDPTVSVYFVNRAMAYLKINSYLEAERDCTRGLQLQPNNVKALWRRGIALSGLGRMNEARKDFQTALTIEPNNKSILDELAKITPEPRASTIQKKPTQQSRKRLSIEVVDEAYYDMAPSSALSDPSTSEVYPRNLRTKIPSDESPISHDNIESRQVKPLKTVQKDDKKDSRSDVRKEDTKKSRSDVRKEDTKDVKKDAMKDDKKDAMKDDTKETHKDTPVDSISKVSATQPIQKPSIPIKMSCPRTSFEFERDWKTYKNRGDDMLYAYFRNISPSIYATLFKSSLESDQLEKMIDMIHGRYLHDESKEKIVEVLDGLSKVHRIDMLIMFLNKKQELALQHIFDALVPSIPKDRLSPLARIFKVKV
ncbi:hypothetical protein BDB01DRAFT_771057 [Pilobolus umbonatus]|nr:hypothetical protein BDB01DRAFT_771057 [Pilobolus umbonatus]